MRLAIALSFLFLLTFSCSDSVSSTSTSTTQTVTPPSTASGEAIFDDLETPNNELATSTDPAICEALIATESAPVSDLELSEISGAVWTDEGVWLHNDSRQDAVLYLVGAPGTAEAGQTIRTIDLSEVAPDIDDPEDIALVNDDLLLADTGDNFNTTDREFVSFYRVDPATGELINTYEFVYPDFPVDAEAVFVDSVTEQLFVIDKQIGVGNLFGVLPDATVYSAQLSEGDVEIFESRPEFRQVASIDLDALNDRSEQPLPGGRVGDAGALVTGVDISADGRTVALRTYQTVWIYQNPPDGSAGWFNVAPCEAPIVPEPQGEAVAIRQDSDTLELLTVSEGVNPPLVRIGQ